MSPEHWVRGIAGLLSEGMLPTTASCVEREAANQETSRIWRLTLDGAMQVRGALRSKPCTGHFSARRPNGCCESGAGVSAFLAVICVRICSAERAVRGGPYDTAIAGVGKGCSFSSHVVSLFDRLAVLRRCTGLDRATGSIIFNKLLRTAGALSDGPV